MRKEIGQYIRGCRKCQQHKDEKWNRIPIAHAFMQPEGFLDIVSMDCAIFNEITKDGNKYMCVFVDNFTRYAWAVAMKAMTTSKVAKALMDSIVTPHHAPRILFTDNGSNFTSKAMGQVCKVLGITQQHSTAYNPRTNGLVERMVGTIKRIVTSMLDNDKQWDRVLQQAMATINSTVNRTTGYSPYRMVYGRDKNRQYNQLKATNMNTTQYTQQVTKRIAQSDTIATETQQKQHKKGREEVEMSNVPKIMVGDKVWIRRQKVNAWEPTWDGPVTATSIQNNGMTITITDGRHNKVYNRKDIKPYHNNQAASSNDQ